MKYGHLVIIVSLAMLYPSIQAKAHIFGSGDNAFKIELVTIGDLANAADDRFQVVDPNDPEAQVQDPAGYVDYVYKIGKFEISREMIEKANAEGGLDLTLDPMDIVTGGPRFDMPTTGVTWNEAAGFRNWLNTSKGFQAAYKFSAQPGKMATAPTRTLSFG